MLMISHACMGGSMNTVFVKLNSCQGHINLSMKQGEHILALLYVLIIQEDIYVGIVLQFIECQNILIFSKLVRSSTY